MNDYDLTKPGPKSNRLNHEPTHLQETSTGANTADPVHEAEAICSICSRTDQIALVQMEPEAMRH